MREHHHHHIIAAATAVPINSKLGKVAWSGAAAVPRIYWYDTSYDTSYD